jgi:hypothetical protein
MACNWLKTKNRPLFSAVELTAHVESAAISKRGIPPVANKGDVPLCCRTVLWLSNPQYRWHRHNISIDNKGLASRLFCYEHPEHYGSSSDMRGRRPPWPLVPLLLIILREASGGSPLSTVSEVELQGGVGSFFRRVWFDRSARDRPEDGGKFPQDQKAILETPVLIQNSHPDHPCPTDQVAGGWVDVKVFDSQVTYPLAMGTSLRETTKPRIPFFSDLVYSLLICF